MNLTEPLTAPRHIGARQLAVRLGGHRYGIPSRRVREVLELADRHALPPLPIQAPLHLNGRGLPLVDLRAGFARIGSEPSEHTRIVDLAVTLPGVGEARVGLVVDAVEGYEETGLATPDPARELDAILDGGFTLGLTRLEDAPGTDN